ncbi:MAG: HEPN domain-containing protein [Candidatus Marsarchaeota archaeon]|nr:HEPN domain-containing protein [Candidatus Marsarchaeota archaeon]
MNEEGWEYVRHRLSRAEESLAEARLLLDGGYLIGTVNRVYYGCFYAVSALLFTEGLTSSKHSGVISAFDRHWIKTGRLPLEAGRLYRTLFELRQEGDYKDVASFDRDEVSELLSQAEAFVKQISVLLTTS